MGCHTWFRNKISDMPQDHLVRLREKTARSCRNAWIVKCSYNEWAKDIDESINSYNDKKKLSEYDKGYINLLKKRRTKEYYSNARNKYLDDAKALENDTTSKDKVLKILAKHNLLFDEDLKNGSYDLGDVGWHDNYRVYGYPNVTHHNADEAIKFLEEYDNGNNIQCDYIKGMCNDIKDIITSFFNEFPNGTIHYG